MDVEKRVRDASEGANESGRRRAGAEAKNNDEWAKTKAEWRSEREQSQVGSSFASSAPGAEPGALTDTHQTLGQAPSCLEPRPIRLAQSPENAIPPFRAAFVSDSRW